MKIKKFNNLNEGSTSLNSTWDNREKFDKVWEMKSKIEYEESTLRPLVRDYLILNPNIQEQIMDLDEDELNITDLYYTPDSTIVFFFYYNLGGRNYDGYDFEACLNAKQFDDFLLFLKNPIIYKNSKKYNI